MDMPAEGTEAQRHGLALERMHFPEHTIDLGATGSTRILAGTAEHCVGLADRDIGEDRQEAIELARGSAFSSSSMAAACASLSALTWATSRCSNTRSVTSATAPKMKACASPGSRARRNEKDRVVAHFAAARAGEGRFDLAQRIDRLDQVLVDLVQPQQPQILGRRMQRLGIDQRPQQILQGTPGQRLQPQQGLQRIRVRAADATAPVDQEQSLANRTQDVGDLRCSSFCIASATRRPRRADQAKYSISPSSHRRQRRAADQILAQLFAVRTH